MTPNPATTPDPKLAFIVAIAVSPLLWIAIGFYIGIFAGQNKWALAAKPVQEHFLQLIVLGGIALSASVTNVQSLLRVRRMRQ